MIDIDTNATCFYRTTVFNQDDDIFELATKQAVFRYKEGAHHSHHTYTYACSFTAHVRNFAKIPGSHGTCSRALSLNTHVYTLIK